MAAATPARAVGTQSHAYRSFRSRRPFRRWSSTPPSPPSPMRARRSTKLAASAVADVARSAEGDRGGQRRAALQKARQRIVVSMGRVEDGVPAARPRRAGAPAHRQRREAHRIAYARQAGGVDGLPARRPVDRRHVVFYIGPMLASLYYSFTNYPIIGSPTWAGLANYGALPHDPEFTAALKVSFTYTVGAVFVYIVISLGLAMLCNRQLPGVGLVRTIVFLPSLIPIFAMALLWGMVFDENFGLANNVLHSLGLPQQGFFQSPTQALPMAISITVWSIGAAFVVFLAGLQSIPGDLYEAIVIDGAGPWSRFWHVTLPMLSPLILFNIVIGFILSFQAFDLDWALTNGGPGTATLFYVYDVWREAFQYFAWATPRHSPGCCSRSSS